MTLSPEDIKNISGRTIFLSFGLGSDRDVFFYFKSLSKVLFIIYEEKLQKFVNYNTMIYCRIKMYDREHNSKDLFLPTAYYTKYEEDKYFLLPEIFPKHII